MRASALSFDVCYYAKIRILKQITTCASLAPYSSRCLLLCKDKNFKANHNGWYTGLTLTRMFVTMQR